MIRMMIENFDYQDMNKDNFINEKFHLAQAINYLEAYNIKD